MANKRKHENKPQRLARGVSKVKRNARTKSGGKSAARPRASRDSGRTMADARQFSPIVRLVQSLGEEKIRFQLVGMSAAILQGVIVTTLDVDMWVDLPERQYVRLMNLVVKQGGTALSPTLYALADGRLVNFCSPCMGCGILKPNIKMRWMLKLKARRSRCFRWSASLRARKLYSGTKTELTFC